MLSGHYFTCHWDESGCDPGTGTKAKSDMPILLAGGYFAHVDEWKEFEKEWKLVLLEYGLKRFHMVDFVNVNLPYGGWDESKRDLLIEKLLAIIAKYPRISVTWAIEIDAYMEIIKARHLLETDILRAYHICARKCIETVHGWAFVARYPHKILHIFDKGNAGWPTFESSFTEEDLDDLGILQPIAQSKTDVVPLQAADILAHQVARNLLISSGRKPEGQRLYTKQLFRKPGLQKYIGIQELNELYRQELILEAARARGLHPRHIVRKVMATQSEIMSALFKEPNEYRINSLLLGL